MLGRTALPIPYSGRTDPHLNCGGFACGEAGQGQAGPYRQPPSPYRLICNDYLLKVPAGHCERWRSKSSNSKYLHPHRRRRFYLAIILFPICSRPPTLPLPPIPAPPRVCDYTRRWLRQIGSTRDTSLPPQCNQAATDLPPGRSQAAVAARADAFKLSVMRGEGAPIKRNEPRASSFGPA